MRMADGWRQKHTAAVRSEPQESGETQQLGEWRIDESPLPCYLAELIHSFVVTWKPPKRFPLQPTLLLSL